MIARNLGERPLWIAFQPFPPCSDGKIRRWNGSRFCSRLYRPGAILFSDRKGKSRGGKQRARALRIRKHDAAAAGTGVTSKTYRVTKAASYAEIEIIRIVSRGERANMQHARVDPALRDLNFPLLIVLRRKNDRAAHRLPRFFAGPTRVLYV